MTHPNATVKALGEIALRVRDLDAMQAFYERVIGLELMQRFPDAAFFRVAEGYRGHTQVLVLFRRDGDPRAALFPRTFEGGFAPPSHESTTVDHIAFAIDRADYEAEHERLESHGLEVATREHDWVGWRSLYVLDPEGNTVELVCHDPAVAG